MAAQSKTAKKSTGGKQVQRKDRPCDECSMPSVPVYLTGFGPKGMHWMCPNGHTRRTGN